MTRMDGTRTTIATVSIKQTTRQQHKTNSDNDENIDCEYQVDDDKDLISCLADWLTQEDKMQLGITAGAQATIDGGMVQSKEKESCTYGSGAAWFFPYYLTL